jgi:TAP-like protein
VLLDGLRWAAALESALYQSNRLGLVPEAISGASDELVAAAAIDQEVKRAIVPGALAAATLSYVCSYDAGPNRTAEISSAAMPEFAGANEANYGDLCEAWDTPSVYDELSQPMLGDVPVLMAQGSISVSGTRDWAGAMADQLDDATVIRFPTMSEDLAYSPPPCLRRLRNQFVVDPDASLDVEHCEQQSPPVTFVGA